MQSLSSAYPFVSILTLLVCIAILVVALCTLRRVGKSVKLAERRMEYLNEEQARLKAFYEERKALTQALGQAQDLLLREVPAFAERSEDQSSSTEEERQGIPELRQQHAQLAEKLGRLQEQQLKADQERESTAEDLRNIQKMLLEERVVAQEPESKKDSDESSAAEDGLSNSKRGLLTQASGFVKMWHSRKPM